MNPLLDPLHPYPFERLRALTRRHHAARRPQADQPVDRRAEASHAAAHQGRARRAAWTASRPIPPTAGDAGAARGDRRLAGAPLRPPEPIPATQVLPVNGSREALFAFAQTVIDPPRAGATVVCPNPFYQIYEGAALLAGARRLRQQRPARNFAPTGSVPSDLGRTQLLYVCSPGNPTGAVMPLDEWQQLFELSRPPRLRDRLRRVLLRDLLPRRSRRSARSRPRCKLGRERFPQPGRLHQPVQALQRARHALRLRRRRRGAPQAVPAVSHLPRQRDEPRRCSTRASRPGTTRRTCARTAPVPRASSPQVTPLLAECSTSDARRRVLPVGRHARSTTPSSRAACSLNTM